MMHQTLFYRLLCLSMGLLLGGTPLAYAQNRVRAKIGIHIESDDKATWAKSRDTLKTGDLMRVYVLPEEDAYIYLVYSDNKTPVLLNSKTSGKKAEKGRAMAFPSGNELYRTDGMHPVEKFTIICSPRELPEVGTLFSASSVSQEQWARLEGDLSQRSKINMGQPSEKPFGIAGNVRGLAGSPIDEALFNELLVSSGESLLVKKYEFSVKK